LTAKDALFIIRLHRTACSLLQTRPCVRLGQKVEGANMQLREIIDCCSHLKVTEKRCLTDEFIEFVFVNEDIAEWHRILSAFLGAPRKPKGKEPNVSDLKITEKTGGIRIEQTLFEKAFENTEIIAKFWPWKDNIHTTLRMALLIK
jgi:hypothetical protein